jgi:hypothetical protein
VAFLVDALNSEDATKSNTWPFHALKAAELSPKPETSRRAMEDLPEGRFWPTSGLPTTFQ